MRYEVESDIEGTSVEHAEAWGWLAIKIAKTDIKGRPDRLFIRAGRYVWIEYKKADEEPTRQQLLRHKELRDHGAEVYWVDSVEASDAILCC